MKFFVVGASRNIGYFAALSFLQEGHSVYYVLRNVSVFDNDEAVKPFVASGQAKLIKGDALVSEDIVKAWTEAVADGTSVDYVVFSVGGTPSFKLTKGFVVNPPNLCTSAFTNVLSAIPRTDPQPRVIIISSYGLTRDAHKGLPFLVKGLHALIDVPHQDKLGMECVAYRAAGWTWKDPKPADAALPEGWESEAGEAGWLQNLVILRPALLTDGKEKGKYRAAESTPGLYTISRRDVAHFIANSVVKDWDQYNGKTWDIGY